MSLSARAAEEAREIEDLAVAEVKKLLTDLRKRSYYGSLKLNISLQSGKINTFRVGYEHVIPLKTT